MNVSQRWARFGFKSVTILIGSIFLMPTAHAQIQVESPTLSSFEIDCTALDKAIVGLLQESGVKQKIGWTMPQETILQERATHNRSVKAAFDARVAELAKTHSRSEATTLAIQEQMKAGPDSKVDENIPWTPIQVARLKALAISDPKSILWNDFEVGIRLRLSPDQWRLVGNGIHPVLTPTQQRSLNELATNPNIWLEGCSARLSGSLTIKGAQGVEVAHDGDSGRDITTFHELNGTRIQMRRKAGRGDSRTSSAFEIEIVPVDLNGNSE